MVTVGVVTGIAMVDLILVTRLGFSVPIEVVHHSSGTVNEVVDYEPDSFPLDKHRWKTTR